jgi:transcriptional regulator with XRE-family HTH domain
MPEPKAKKQQQHVIAWLRETLGLTQSGLANLIGSSQSTIQAVELGRIPLSERFAYAIESKTGMPAKWLLENKLEPIPDAAEVKERFEWGKLGGFKYSYEGHLIPRLAIFRTAAVLSVVAGELGLRGTKAAGCFKMLDKISSDFINAIGDLSTRRRVYRDATEILASNETTLELLRTQIVEMIRATKEIRKQRKEDEVEDQRWREEQRAKRVKS